MTALLEARDVSVRIGGALLVDGASFDVAAGEVVALVGPNGAGKSTLLAALAGDRAVARGEVRIAGRAIAGQSPRALAAQRAVLRQRSTLTAAFTALEVVRLGQPRADDRAALAALARVELDAFAHRSYPSLSGGEQQRVQLARLLAQIEGRRMVVLLDEPTAALDLRHRHLVSQLGRAAAAQGHAVAIVEHDLGLAARCADRVVMLTAGRIVGDGPPRDVLTAPRIARAFGVAVELAAEVVPA